MSHARLLIEKNLDRKGRGMKQRPAPRRFCSSSSLTFRDVP